MILAANHRSYFDVVALAIVAARLGRPVRFLAKRELFDAPVVGQLARALGGIPVDRGSGSDTPLRDARRALEAGEVVVILPQGTIPRGKTFFDTVLKGKTGTARLAAMTGAPVVPHRVVGDRSGVAALGPVPHVTNLLHPRPVRVRVGSPCTWGSTTPCADTEAIMAAIMTQLPAESQRPHEPTAEELARTFPPDHAEPLRARPADADRARARLVAGRASTAVSSVSRRLASGAGRSSAGGWGCSSPPTSSPRLAAGPPVALVTGTNGKTTTTRLLAAALGGRRGWPTSSAGANLPPGLATALASAAQGAPAVLEVDEGYLGAVAARRAPEGDRPAQPVARPARPGERGPHGGGPLARHAGRARPRPTWSPTPMTR